jgi:cell division protein FtsA
VARRNDFIGGLDVGSSKTCALVCQLGEGSKPVVLGWGVAESKGWRKGVITNLDAVVLSIKKAVEEAETKAGVPLDTAYVGVAGPHIKGVNSHGVTALGERPREVTLEDKGRVLQAAQGISLPAGRELLHAWPQEFLVDSQDSIREPMGMTGTRLEAHVHLVTASTTALESIVTAVNRAGIAFPEINGTVFEAMACAEACLAPDERELGIALLDIGGESSNLIVYQEGTVRHTASLPLGGEHFTNDIAVGLRTPIPEAEKVKRAWGERDAERPADGMLEIPGVGDRPSRVVSYAQLGEIIEPRAIDLVELVEQELTRAGCRKQLGAGIALCGGGAKLGGLALFAEQRFELPVRVARPAGLEKMGEELSDPAFATVVGLVCYGRRQRLMRETRERGWAGKLWSALSGRS